MIPQTVNIRETWTVYLLECADHTYYCGVCKTGGLKERIEQHNRGQGARYTRGRRPVRLIACSRSLGKKAAYRAEYRLKRRPRRRKYSFLKNL